MVPPQLTAEFLLVRGFREVGCWELDSSGGLSHRIELPVAAGVYAFAIGGLVQYVGVASASLRQRLGFYRKPGVSQRTNTRLNELIRRHLQVGKTVQILIAHPPNQEWNGLRIKGAEGLEAGMIESFDLPWNMRGSQRAAVASNAAKVRRRERALASQIQQLLDRTPGLTELEIARAIYGPAAVQQLVNQHCRQLVDRGQLQRRGAGGRAEPFTYFPVE